MTADLAQGSASTTPADHVDRLRDALEAAFHAARVCAGTTTRTARVAGHPVRLVFASTSLEHQMMPALSHVETDTWWLRSDLTVNVWTSAEIGSIADPPTPSASSGELPPGAFLHYSHDGVHVSYQPARRILNVFDAGTRRAWFWVGDGQLPYWERSAPLRHILHWWMSSHGVQQLHSSAVGDGSHAALVVGRSGSGKSTVALAALEAGLAYVGDDYVLAASDPTPVVHSTYCSGKLTDDQVRRFPRLVPAITNEKNLPAEKALFYVTDLPSATVATSLPLAALLVPVITGERDTCLTPVRRATGLAALAPSTLLEVFTAGGLALKRMRALVDRLPCYHLLVGRDLSQIGPVVADLLGALPVEPA